jgi:hypothetical protein
LAGQDSSSPEKPIGIAAIMATFYSKTVARDVGTKPWLAVSQPFGLSFGTILSSRATVFEQKTTTAPLDRG